MRSMQGHASGSPIGPLADDQRGEIVFACRAVAERGVQAMGAEVLNFVTSIIIEFC